METLYALCLNERQLAVARAGWGKPTLAMPPPGTDYVRLYESQTPEWDQGYDRELAAASAGGEALLLRWDRFGQLEVRVFIDGRLVRDLFFHDSWQRVTGQPFAWEAAVLGCAVAKPGDEAPYGGDGAGVEAALRAVLKLP